MMEDSLGYTYNRKRKGKVLVDWQCTKRNKEIQCTLTIKQTLDVLIRHNIHHHPAEPGTVKAVKITAANLFAPSGALKDDVLVEHMNPDAIGNSTNLARLVNRHSQKLWPFDPTDLDFVFDESFILDSFFGDEVTVGTSRNFIFATDDQLSKVADTRIWYVDETFKVVKEPTKQLLGFHGFLKSGKNMEQCFSS
ncbi:Hypp8294 [Branchiostoma lanceolatum]|uniref:Hypp8294 protein n=1 Tax=Branchiostoma lanceolatum TaxID=7740 RepID=A0A8J9Z7W3_BRALA|nr:Hypp8294 [Branchiostoma lanceolatum]